jgi:hypothetical protein
MDLKVRRAFSTLVQEVSNYIDKFGGFDLELYGLTQESMKDINELPMIVELAKVIMRFIRSNYTPNWNSFGYDDIFNQLTLPNAMFQYIFVCENILRKFIIQVLDDNGYQTIDSIGNQKLSKAIQNKKNKETTQNYLPIRGDHDIYYLDLIELNKIFIKLWNECFIDKFERQSWICERIESLYTIRNRVAHSSSYLTSDELRSVETRCREIIKQIDQNIK